MIIIQNGRLIDPKSQTDAIMDLVIDRGKIIAMGPQSSQEFLSEHSPSGC